ncbi:MAG: choice-of-anchor R domain-containing protein [Halioglobus sp.]
MTLIRTLLVTIVWFGVAQAHSAAIFSQSPPVATGGYKSDFAFNFVNQQAQQFSLGSDTAIQAVVAWGAYAAGAPADNFTIRVFADTGGGAPEVLPVVDLPSVAVVREDTGGLELGLNPIYKYTFNLVAPINLLASTTYYLSVVNNTSDAQSWSWVEAAATNNERWDRAADGDAWFTPQPGNVAFELHDAPIIIQPPTPPQPQPPQSFSPREVPLMPVGLLGGLVFALIVIARRFIKSR